MPTDSTKPIIFISYCQKDEPDPNLHSGFQWLSFVQAHLAPGAAHGHFDVWSDQRMEGGGDWRAQIDGALEGCAVAILLVSVNFLSSPFILDVEVKRMLERHHADGLRLYPILITPADLGAAEWLRNFTLRPTHLTALSQYPEGGARDKVMADLAAEIRTIVEKRPTRPASATPASYAALREAGPVSALAPIVSKWEGDFSAVGVTVSGRDADLKRLTDNANEPGVAVIAVTALAGQGKTALVRAWIEQDVSTRRAGTFHSVFAFSFYGHHTQHEFARTLAAFLDPAAVPADPEALPAVPLVDLLHGRRILFFLDGLEEIQNEEPSGEREGDAKGRVAQGPVLELLFDLCVGRASGSIAVITSRLRLAGFEEFDETRAVVGLELEGLTPEAGGKLLLDLGVRDTREKREEYGRDLMGHPLLLRVFADAVKRRALAVHFGNAAEKVAEAMGLAAPIAFRDKLVRVVDWYRAQFSEQERAIIEAVAVFGGTATIHRIRAYLRQRKGPPSSVAEAAVASQIEALLAAGILQFDDKGAHRYGCHPILRERFQPDQAGTRSAAAISLYSRPAPLRPRTLAEAEPYLDAIRIHTNAGAFKEAAIILGRHLDSGDVLYDFVGGYRALLDGLLGFLRRDRRNACEAQLGRGWLIAMVPRIVMAGIALYEWEIADDYARWDAALTAQDPNIKRSLNFSLRASIAAEIGAADDARALYEAAIATADPGSRGALMLERAELERALGAPRESLRLLGEWMEVDQPFASWIIGWPVALETLGSIFKRTHPAFAQRCAKAWEIARTAIVSDALQIDSNYFAEYLRLDMIVRADRTERDWQRLLELANLMERHHKIYATKSLGSWPIGRVIALNGLGRTDEAVKLAWSSIHQLHGHSWRRLWLRTEIARARLLQGHMRGGQDDACNIIHTARMRQRYLIARDAAELVVEHGGTPETDRIREAQRMLGEFNERMQLAEADIPHLGPLPGEPGWDERVTLRLLREVRAEEQNGPATQEELDAALVLAAEIGISSAIVELLRLGASPRAAREGGKSALRVAIEHGHRQAVETMLDASSEPVDLESQRDVEAITAAVASSHSDILKRLLDGCVTMEPDHLAAILAAAATVSSGETIRVLCGAGADPGRLCEDQHPLVRAARTGNLGAVEVLAECIGDINKAADADGETALMAAMAAGREPVIIWLVDRSARLDARDNSGRTAIDYAVLRGRVQALELLAAVTGRDVFADVDPTRLAVGASYHGEAGELRRAVEHGAQLDQLSPQGETALVAAAARGHLDVIRVIRELAPDISIDTQDRGGVTGLMAAAGNGADAIVTALVREFGARFDMTDAENRDAMMYALIRNQPDTINLLSSLGASPRNTRETFAAMVGAAAANNRSALVAFLTAVAKAGWINTFAEEAHGLDVIANALIAQVRRVAGSKLVLPTRLPEELTDSDLEAQPCAVLQAGSSTYAGLPLAAAPQTLIDRFTGAAASKIANIDEFDADRMRIAEAPWLGGLLALLPHRENRIEVPFFVTDDSVILAGRTNEWIYEAMSGRPPPQCDDNLLAHVRFFFATVIGRLGAFHFAERMDDAIWLPDASEDVKREFAEKLQSLHIIGTAEDGRQELRVTVVFKNALFVTSVMVAPDWVMELANEDLLMEELPIAFGQRIDLLVRR